MALDLTQEQKAIGKKNYEQAVGDLSRREFMKKSMVAGAAVVPVSAAAYYGYQSWKGNKAVRTALIGCGDEGGVLIGDHNPEFNEIVAVVDPRPYNIERIFTGDPAPSPRKGLNNIYGKDVAAKIARYDSLSALLADKTKLGLEAVIIATPLHLHHPMVTQCLKADLHVLSEKLMGRTIGLCKDMIRTAYQTGKLLSIGHQRHYSTLYAHAREVVESGILGDIKHIRALWHRNNSWLYDPKSEKLPLAAGFDIPYYRDGWCKPIYKMDADKLNNKELLKELGYDSLEQLVRWRLFNSTGGGLMAELGSHQLDASSIFLGNVHPISVLGSGGKFFYGPGKNDRQSDDSVFVTYEFPGKNHPTAGKGGTDKSDVVVVTYTSFNTNSFEKYGECLMGSRGTMVVEEEKDVYLFKEAEPGKANSGGRDTNIVVTGEAKKANMESSSTWGGGGGAAISKDSKAPAWDSAVRGYRTEMEHFAYLVRKWDKGLGWAKKDGKFQQDVPHCHGEVAMADAILALTANIAMKRDKEFKPMFGRIEFKPEWFNVDSPETPEDLIQGGLA